MILRQKDFLDIASLSRRELLGLLTLGITLKRRRRAGRTALKGSILAMIFQKPSLRTRVSFDAAMRELGGHAIYLGPQDIQLGAREAIPDVARTLSRYVHAIMARVFDHAHLEELARSSSVPVINGLSNDSHPCQILADLMTILERKKRLTGVKVTFLGDGGSNVARSLIEGCVKVGASLVIAAPPGFHPALRREGSQVEVTEDPRLAARGAEVLYTDVWASMGEEREAQERAARMRPYQLNNDLLKLASPGCIVMHCLPAHRGEEITREVLEGPASIVFDQAENRLHAQKALLLSLRPARRRPIFSAVAGSSGGRGPASGRPAP